RRPPPPFAAAAPQPTNPPSPWPSVRQPSSFPHALPPVRFQLFPCRHHNRRARDNIHLDPVLSTSSECRNACHSGTQLSRRAFQEVIGTGDSTQTQGVFSRDQGHPTHSFREAPALLLNFLTITAQRGPRQRD